MANLNETAIWEAGIYQWETSDPVQGGPNGIDNKPTRQLANRTLWLKTELAKAVASIGKNKTDAENMFARKTTTVTAGAGLTGGGTLGGNVQFALGTPGTCSGNTTNWAGSDTHTHQLAAASPTVAGVAKLINNLTTDDANSALSAAMGKKLAEEKIPNTTQDFMGKLGEFNPGKSGFVRTNGGSLYGNSLPSMEIHLGHPGYANGAYSRGIGFAYGHTGWGLTTTAWDEQGNYRGQKQILTEENGVMLTGNQDIAGTKTFTGTLTAKYRIAIRRNDAQYSPYQLFLDESVNLADTVAKNKVIGLIEWRAGDTGVSNGEGRAKAVIRADLQTDKNCNLEWGTWSSANQYSTGIKLFGASNNLVVGGGVDNAQGRLQVNGTAYAKGFYTSAGITWPKLQLCSTSGNQALLIESSGVAGTHKLIIRTHTNGVVGNGNIATFALPDVTGDKTLATRDDVAAVAPSGTVAYFAGRNAPAGWLKANGAAVSRTTYAALFAAIGTTYGAGDGRTTFNLPDLRGEFVRGFDDGRNVDRGRALGSAQNQSMADHYHGIGVMNTTDDILIVNKNWSGGDNEYPVMEMAGEYNKVLKGRISSTRLIDGGTLTDGGRAYAPGNGSAFHAGRVHHIATAMQDLSGNSSETRPRNVALLACIKI